MTGYEQDCLREVAKWLNEEPNKPAPTEAIATLCTALQVEMAKLRLLTSTARRKLAELEADGHLVCGLAIKRGETHGLITDFGKVLWWPASSNAEVKGD
jgi:hypothetical protein